MTMADRTDVSFVCTGQSTAFVGDSRRPERKVSLAIKAWIDVFLFPVGLPFSSSTLWLRLLSA